MAKEYEELDFTDDFMFGKVLYHNPELCKELLELILNKKIRKICFPETQKSISITGDSKGVRFDVYTEDSENIIYDVEMQTTTNENLPKRSRYYHNFPGTGGVSHLHKDRAGFRRSEKSHPKTAELCDACQKTQRMEG